MVPYTLNRKAGKLASMLPDKFTDADVKSAYERLGQGTGRGVAGIRDGWEEETLALQEEAMRSAPEARLDGIEETLRALTKQVDKMTRTVREIDRVVSAHSGNATGTTGVIPRLAGARL